MTQPIPWAKLSSAVPLRVGEAVVIQASVGKAMPLHPKSANARAIDKAAEDFEAVFLNEMLQGMFEGVETDSMFGGGYAEDVYRSLLVDEYGKLLARSGGIGIADHVKRELIQFQEME